MPKTSFDSNQFRHALTIEVSSGRHFVAKIVAVRAELEYGFRAICASHRRDVVERELERFSDCELIGLFARRQKRRQGFQPCTSSLAKNVRDIRNEGLRVAARVDCVCVHQRSRSRSPFEAWCNVRLLPSGRWMPVRMRRCAGRGGEIGRRSGLKIRRPQGLVGSIPTPGTIFGFSSTDVTDGQAGSASRDAGIAGGRSRG